MKLLAVMCVVIGAMLVLTGLVYISPQLAVIVAGAALIALGLLFNFGEAAK